LLRSGGSALNGNQKTLRLLGAGVACLLGGWLWSLVFPFNKNLWTSSFALLTGGISLLLLALFHWVIDVRGIQKWAFFFTVIGMNSILIYMAAKFVDFDFTARAVFGGLLNLLGSGPVKAVLAVLAVISLKWALLWLLDRKRIYLRV
jgi:predicted acyltransferase